jgi:hypothetical protein
MPLGDYGGPTLTHALLAGSPAIDAGDPTFDPFAYGPPLLYDQRGAPFARVDVLGGRRIDVGAYELHPPAALPGDYDRDRDVDGADFLAWQRGLGAVVVPYTGADGNGDCAVDGADCGVWTTNFGQTLPLVVPKTSAAVVAAGDPSDLGWLALGATAVPVTRGAGRFSAAPQHDGAATILAQQRDQSPVVSDNREGVVDKALTTRLRLRRSETFAVRDRAIVDQVFADSAWNLAALL